MKAKQILILGATSDMAKACGELFGKKGFELILAARNVQRLEPYASDLKIRYGIKSELLEFNAVDYESHPAIVSNLPESCEVVICAFGYLGDQLKAEEEWQESKMIIESNYLGAVSILNLLASKWKAISSGSIIGISSVAGDRGRSSNYIYGSAKSAFSTYLDGLRNKLFHYGVHVVTVKPGFVATKMTSHLDLPKPLTSNVDSLAKAIYKSWKNKKNTVYISGIWFWIMFVIKMIPEMVFKRLKM